MLLATSKEYDHPHCVSNELTPQEPKLENKLVVQKREMIDHGAEKIILRMKYLDLCQFLTVKP